MFALFGRNFAGTLQELAELSEHLGRGHFLTFPWPPRFALASTLIYHSGHND